MGFCVAFKDNTQQKCGQITEPGRKFCEEHSKVRAKGQKERENGAIGEVIDAVQLFEAEEEPSKEVVTPEGSHTIKKVPREQKNIYDKTNDLLDRTISWEEKTFNWLNGLSEDELRWKDQVGAEHTHSYVAMYERAMDRVLRGVTAIAKLNIDAQSVNVNKMMREVVKTCVTKALERAELDRDTIALVRVYLSEEFEKVSSEAS